MVRQRNPCTTVGGRKGTSNTRPTADLQSGGSPKEGEISNSGQNITKPRNKRSRQQKSPDVLATHEESTQKNELNHIPTRFSKRQAKRVKKESLIHSPPQKGNVKETKNNTPETNKVIAKGRRPWELWTATDKKLFFEGLFQYGKDFDAIQDFIQRKVGKKTQPHLLKNKDQVRFFYYRTWNKIQKHIGTDDNVEKSAQELYGLINYGELRKRCGAGLKLDEKNGQKLRELVNNGITTIKFRGKNYRLRTPVCSALKILNKLEEEQKEERFRLPDQLTVELRPKNNEAWAQVQCCSHNPHVRMKVKPGRQLSSVFSYIKKKWRTPDDKFRNSTKGLEVKSNKELKLSLPDNSNIYSVGFKTAEAAPRLEITLGNYKEHVKGRLDSPNNKDLENTGDITDEAIDKSKLEIGDNSPQTVQRNTDIKDSAEDKLINTDKKDGDSEDQTIKDSDKFSPKTTKIPEIDHQEAKMRKGWTEKNVKSFTLGEIYLALGRPQTVILEYEWCEIKVNSAAFHLLNLNNMLRRLVHLASSQLMDVGKDKQNTSPGRCKCGKSISTPTSSKSPGSSRSPAVRSKDPSTPKAGGRRGSVFRHIASAAVKTSTELDRSGDDVFIVPMGLPPKPPPSPKPGVPVTTIDGTKFLQQFGSMQNQRYKMKNRMTRRPLLVQRRLLPKAQTVTVAMVPNQVGGMKPSILPVTQALSNPTLGHTITDRTVLSPVNVSTPCAMIGNVSTPCAMIGNQVMSNQSSLASIISAAACQSGIMLTDVISPPKAKDKEDMRPSTPTALSSGLKRRITPTPVPSDRTLSPSLSNPSSPFVAISTNVSRNSPGHPTSVHVSDVLHELASVVNQDVSSIAPSIPAARSPVISPPNISSLLDISIPPHEISEFTSKLRDGFSGLLAGNSTLTTPHVPGSSLETMDVIHHNTPIGSPNRSPLKMCSPLPAWLNGEDFSLSSFLNDSPQKKIDPPSVTTSSTVQLMSEFSSDSQTISKFDVDTTFQCMMNENSMDYINKFADLAAQIAGTSDTSKNDNLE